MLDCNFCLCLVVLYVIEVLYVYVGECVFLEEDIVFELVYLGSICSDDDFLCDGVFVLGLIVCVLYNFDGGVFKVDVLC